MPTTIEATYRAVTPLFCAGADRARPELRLPSFKGVLRFWWRALAWPRYAGDLTRIRQREDSLFGSVGGQSRVLMRLERADQEPKTCNRDSVLTAAAGGREPVGAGARYLGYGVMEAFDSKGRSKKAGQLTRGCLRTPFEFTVRLRCREVCEVELVLLRDALIALGTLGGMGAKSRKGYGSLALRSLRVGNKRRWSAPEALKDLQAEIGKLRYEQEEEDLPEYTAFSSRARHVLLYAAGANPLELLDLVGRELVRYRSWGRNGKILEDEDSEKKFRDDHDLMKGGRPAKHPRRIAFGLPHNYGRRQVIPRGRNLDRRASPLFIHIHECGGTPVAVLSFLPARFLPRGTTISVDHTKVRMAPEQELYRPIHCFLDRLLDWKRREEPFDEAIEVRP